MNKPVIKEEDLHAYIDGQLPATAPADVEAWLRDHPQDAERVVQYQRQNAALHKAYDDLLDQPVPQNLSAAASRKPRLHGMLVMRYAAVLAWFAVGGIVGGVGGWKLHDWQTSKGTVARTTPSFARQAAVAHVVYSPEVRHPVEVGADQEAHLAAWL